MWVMQYHAVTKDGKSVTAEIDIQSLYDALRSNPPEQAVDAWISATLYGVAQDVTWTQIGLKRVDRG